MESERSIFDVTVSVWNKLHSFPLISGLTRGGFNVRALGTSRSRPNAASYECCWPSAIATQLSFKIPKHRERMIRWAQWRFEKFAAKRFEPTRCLWGWSNHNLLGFQRAKNSGVPVIVETGSTHIAWWYRVLAEEFSKRGISLTSKSIDDKRSQILAEYAIADHICVPSHFVAKTFTAYGCPSHKLHVNPYGADIAFWGKVVRGFKPGKRPFVFVFTGQIMLRKGVHYLIDAWKKFDNAQSELWLVGGVFPDCEPIMANLPPRVRLLGSKEHLELRDIYAQADAFILPSLEEGLPRALLEAMAAGLPVIVTEETGAKDIMNDGGEGWIVPSTDSTALAAILEDAAVNPEKTFELGCAARRMAQALTWEAYGQRAAAFLSSVLSGR